VKGEEFEVFSFKTGTRGLQAACPLAAGHGKRRVKGEEFEDFGFKPSRAGLDQSGSFAHRRMLDSDALVLLSHR
jgi:hypothetical protein